MKQQVTIVDFHQAFSIRDDFSFNGLNALFEYLKEYEESTGEEIELDAIALCCEFSEDTIENVLKNYNLESLDELRDQTTIIEIDNENIIYQVF